jgi:hypothetical protein
MTIVLCRVAAGDAIIIRVIVATNGIFIISSSIVDKILIGRAVA